MGHSHGGTEPKTLQTTQVFERFANLAGLVVELNAVVEILPDAAAAYAERWTVRLHTIE
jgi:hypothetical protein